MIYIAGVDSDQCCRFTDAGPSYNFVTVGNKLIPKGNKNTCGAAFERKHVRNRFWGQGLGFHIV